MNVRRHYEKGGMYRVRTIYRWICVAAVAAALAWMIPVHVQTAVKTIELQTAVKTIELQTAVKTIELERTVDGYDGVMDTWLKPDTRDTHCGNQQNLVIGYWDSRALLRFDVSNIPRGATITSATLKLYCHYAKDPRDSRSISAYAVLRDWKEMEATHDQYAKSNKWQDAPGDGVDDRARKSQDTVRVTAAGKFYEWNLKHLVQDWIDRGVPNYGVMLVPRESRNSQKAFFSSEKSSARPHLTISYFVAPDQSRKPAARAPAPGSAQRFSGTKRFVPVQEMPLSLYGVSVGTKKTLTVVLPANCTAAKAAVLMLRVDDIDRAREATLSVNGEGPLPWPRSILGEGKRSGAVMIDPKSLRAGRNTLAFTFKDNLGGKTGGFDVLDAELRLYGDISDEQLARVVRKAGRWGAAVAPDPIWGLPTDADPIWGAPVQTTPYRGFDRIDFRSKRIKQASPDTEELFQDQPLTRWKPATGDWRVKQDVVMYDVDVTDIYQTDEEPSHLAWVGLWKQPNGVIKTSFDQITGNLGLVPSYRAWYGRGMTQQQWEEECSRHPFSPNRVSAEDIKTLSYASMTLSTGDGGETWRNLGPRHEPRGGNIKVYYARNGRQLNERFSSAVVCRGGRIVASAPYAEYTKVMPDNKYLYTKCLMLLRESVDNGKTWSDRQLVIPQGLSADHPLIAQTEASESAMIELSDGRIFVIMRRDPEGPVKTYLTRVGPGRYKATIPEPLPFPNSGMPSLVRGSDGVIWYWDIRGHWYSTDEGETWKQAPLRLRSYYGKMVEAQPNQMLCVTQYLNEDCPYPHFHDAAIRQYRFRWKRSGIVEQSDRNAPMALARNSNVELADLHLRMDLRANDASGVAFRIQPGTTSCYVAAVVLPGTPGYEKWSPPRRELPSVAVPATLLAYAAQGEPMLVLGRVDDGTLTVLSGIRMKSLKPNALVRLQVKAKGDLIIVAARTPGSHAVYTTARDDTFARGALGLLTDNSAGTFSNLYVWSKPQMMRYLWEQIDQ